MEDALQKLITVAEVYRKGFVDDFSVDVPKMMDALGRCYHEVCVEAEIIQEGREI